MADLETLVVKAQSNDLDAYSSLVRQFQDMAVGYAFSILGDFHLAEDAAQEAFVQAYLDLGKLRKPIAFAGWFKRIVYVRCGRIIRIKRVPTLPLKPNVVSDLPQPDEILEQQERRDLVLCAIQALPESEREVTTLYYLSGYAQKEVGEFLEIPTKTVKSRLHTARQHLKERMMNMVEENLQGERPSKDPSFEIKVIQELEQITRLTDREIQLMLREVDTKDLALAMINSSESLQERIFANVSARVEGMIRELMDSLEPVAEDRITRTRGDIIQIIQNLIEKGNISWPPSLGKPPGKELSPEYLAMKKDLLDQFQNTSISNLNFDKLTETIVNLASVARFEGVLKLQDFHKQAQDHSGGKNEFFELGLRLIIDGFATHLVDDLMESKKKAFIQQYDTQLSMIKAGIISTQIGNDPGTIDQKLRVMY